MMPPDNWYEPMIMPVLLTVIGAFIWWLAWLGERGGKTSPWKWIALLFILPALWIGFQTMSHLSDIAYYSAMRSHIKRFILPHYIAFVLPLLALIGALVTHFMPRKGTQVPATE